MEWATGFGLFTNHKRSHEITKIFEKQIPFTYIADGHHRAASAAKVKNAMGKDATPESAYFLTTLFPHDELHIMDYNRLVKDLNGLDASGFIEKLNKISGLKKSNSTVFTRPLP